VPFREVGGVFVERPVAGGDVDEGEDGFVGHAVAGEEGLLMRRTVCQTQREDGYDGERAGMGHESAAGEDLGIGGEGNRERREEKTY